MKNPFQRKKSLDKLLAESKAKKQTESPWPGVRVSPADDASAETSGSSAPEPEELPAEEAPAAEPEPTPEPEVPTLSETPEPEWRVAPQPADVSASEPELISEPEPEAVAEPEPEPAAEPEPEPGAAAVAAAYPPDEFSPEWTAVPGNAAAAAAESAASETEPSPAEPSAPTETGPDAADVAIAAAAASATAAAASSGRKKQATSIVGKRPPRRGKATKPVKTAKAAKPAKEPRERVKKQRPDLFGWITGSFKDPERRPRAIVWTLASVLGLAAVMIVALGATSTYWFCANGCHKVQDDTINAYQASTHNKISCMSCHMPVGASPVTFILHKAEALGELYMTVTNNYELPLNGQNMVSLEMPSKQCTQCHTVNREITPTSGIKIDHKAHADRNIQCPECHNRIAHNDAAVQQTLNDPKTGEKNTPHENFMSMNACFRCHTQAAGGLAPGTCTACHPENFQLKPKSHLAPGFFPAGHGKLGKAEADRVRKAKAEEAKEAVSGETTQAEKQAEPRSGEATPVPEGVNLPAVETINTCYTCHDQETFCNKCHGGVEMPHPVGFKAKHSSIARKYPKSCETCHGKGNEGCNSCHHGSALGWKYNPDIVWKEQHPQAVQAKGATACFACHEPTYCAHCHVSGTPGQ